MKNPFSLLIVGLKKQKDTQEAINFSPLHYVKNYTSSLRNFNIKKLNINKFFLQSTEFFVYCWVKEGFVESMDLRLSGY